MESDVQAALQDDLDFWRKKLAASRNDREIVEAEIAAYLDYVNEVKRAAHEKGIELT